MKLLFICTHNRCRSILCEAITRHAGGPGLEAASAGSQPAGEIHPLTLEYLDEAGVPVQGLSSQSWDDLESFAPDVVITVCNNAAGEACPVWFGQAIRSHWDLKDPSALADSPAAVASAFRATIALIRGRVDTLRHIATLPRDQWPDALEALAHNHATV